MKKSNIFTTVPAPHVKTSLFDLSHEVKMSGKFGFLYPVLCLECLPGDRISDSMNVFIRFAPMLAPVLHRMDVTTHFFKVPNRLLTDHWEDFITGGQDGTAVPVLPYLEAGDITDTLTQKGTLWDYLGLPIWDGLEAHTSQEQISALPFRAVAKIWNDYYRDPNLQAEIDLDVELQGNVTIPTAMNILPMTKYRRAFQKDYFTSALPWAQRGAQVLMPLSGTAADTDITYKVQSEYVNFDDTLPAAGATTFQLDAGTRALRGTDNKSTRVENIDEITFNNAATTINDLRRALAIQKWLEANARGGARYVEQIQGHFNVRVPDYRLSRAEYLGGGRQPVSISEVLSTAESGTKDVGDMLGHGISVGKTNHFSYQCQEHGFIIAILSVTMQTAYSQGLSRMWTRKDKFDYAWPELANLGEQEILSKEIFYSFSLLEEANNQLLFGYIPRYAEYKFHNDRIAGDFRDNLGFWHLGRNFTARPTLDINLTTIFEDGGGEEETFRRIFAVQDGTDYLWMQLYHTLKARRPLPYFGVPTI